jgi:hypothetical protein
MKTTRDLFVLLATLLAAIMAAAPAGAKKLAPDALIELDELPPAAAEGGK